MDQEKQAPDTSTNLPHGSAVDQGEPADVERESPRRENESIEGTRQSVREAPTTLRTGEVKPLSTIDRLNDFVRGELAGIETYDLALQALGNAEWTGTLRQIRDNHEQRAHLLRERIRALGGEPASSSGVWGAFVRAMQRGADLLGSRVALAALEEGEELLLKRYGRETSELQSGERTFVERELLPQQVRTNDLARSLEKFVKAA